MPKQDKLDMLVEIQSNLQSTLGYTFKDMSSVDRVSYIKEYAQHLDGEMFEMMRELPYFKSWKKYPESIEAQQVMFAKAKLEWADVLHFFLNITLALGFTADELFAMFCEKNSINHERQSDHNNYKPCIGE